jgi:hypothetical protein
MVQSKKGGDACCRGGRRISALLLCGVILAVNSPRIALGQVTYISNLSDPSVGGPLYPVYNDNSYANEFATGANAQGYNLNSIQVLMGSQPGEVATSGFVTSIYSNSGGEPGVDLGDLSGSSDPVTPGTYTYTASGITLSPLTDYWVVLASTGNAPGVIWDATESTSYISSNGWSLSTRGVSNNQGTGWMPVQLANFYGQFSVTATAVPEPHTLALAAIALPALFCRRKHFAPVA